MQLLSQILRSMPEYAELKSNVTKTFPVPSLV